MAGGAGDAQRLALAHPWRDLHVDRARTAALVEHDAALRARKGLFDGHFQVARIRLGRRRPRRAPKQTGEEIAEAIEIGKPLTAAGVPETLRPIRRRPELLTGPVVSPQLIVGRTLFRIAEHLIGLLNLFEFGLRVLFLADVGMKLASQLAVGAFYLIGFGAASHT